MLSSSPRLTRTSLVCLAAASILFVIADWPSLERADFTPFPMPRPGASVTTSGYLTAAGKYALWVDVALDSESESLGPGEELECAIDVEFVANGHSMRLAPAASLQHAADYHAGHVRTYSTEVFEMPKGNYDLNVSNKGCVGGQFRGGMMYLNYYHPVTIGWGFMARAAAFVLTLFGLLALALSSLRHAIRSRTSTVGG